jgi:hypothetical protein
MGLLDDAIREHLDLKRRRGADPGEVAREQREVLDSGSVEDASDGALLPEESVSGAPLVDPAVASPGDAPPEVMEAEDRVHSPAPAEPGNPPSDVGGISAGETAELDMSTVLGEDIAHQSPSEAAADVDHPSAADPAATEGDSLEWEMPSDAQQDEAQEPDEDVLEETPEFLRDTPEQERLWFEQRPPRDFDFDK